MNRKENISKLKLKHTMCFTIGVLNNEYVKQLEIDIQYEFIFFIKI